MKRVAIGLSVAFLIGLFIVIAVQGFGFSTYDYDLKCTKCLRDYHVVEYKYLGLTYSKTEHLNLEGNDLSQVFGEPCQHIYRKGEYGRQIGGLMEDGETAEGQLFSLRWKTIASAFDLYKKFPNKELLRKTFQITDSILPPDATLDYMHNPKSSNEGFLFLLSHDLEVAKSEKDWADALKKIETEMIAGSK